MHYTTRSLLILYNILLPSVTLALPSGSLNRRLGSFGGLGSLGGGYGITVFGDTIDSIFGHHDSSSSDDDKVKFSTSSNPPPGQLSQVRGPNGPYVKSTYGPSYASNWANTTLVMAILELTDKDKKPSSGCSSEPSNPTCFDPSYSVSSGWGALSSNDTLLSVNGTDVNLLMNHMAKIMKIQDSAKWDPKAAYMWDSGTDEPGDPRRAVIEFFPKDDSTTTDNFPPGAMLRIASALLNTYCPGHYGGQAFLQDHTGWGVRIRNRAN